MLYLSAIILSFFLAFVLITKKEKTSSDYILFAWLCVTGFHLLTFYLFSTGQYLKYPGIVSLGFPLPLAQGPFLYLYTCQQTSSARFKKKRLLHFLPIVLSYMMFAKYYLLSAEEQAEVYRRGGTGYELQIAINLYAVYLSGIVYVTISLIRLLKYRKKIIHQFSNTEKINFNWLLYLIIWVVFIWIVVLFVREDKLIFSAAALFVVWLSYFSLRQVQVYTSKTPELEIDSGESENSNFNVIDFSKTELDESPVIQDNVSAIKYQKSTLTDEAAGAIHDRLKNLMDSQKPFKNPDLTLNELAGTLDVHPNQLSQVINTREKKNFYDLINEKRVEEFIHLLSSPASQQYTLLALAFDCGFNSKASFNRNFKKYTGQTPSEYQKQQPEKN